MNRYVRYGLCLALGLCLAWMLLDTTEVTQAVSDGITLCVEQVIPALFPFLVVSSMLIKLGFSQIVARLFGRWMEPLFHQDGLGGTALFLGLVGGYPMGPRTVAQLYQDGHLPQAQANRLLCFVNNSNPAFLITVLGVGVFKSPKLGLYLWVIHVVAALLVGVLLRPKKRPTPQVRRSVYTVMEPSLSKAFVSSVTASLSAMGSICAFVVLFYVLAVPLTHMTRGESPLLVGIVELFSATPLLPNTATGFIIAAGLSGWGGVSVLCQTAAVLDGSGLEMRWCVIGKALQGAVSAVLAAIIIS
ncbi:sporulation protein [Bengtsoniella intestinalis]|uniref:nucleoside recognition domain-containing protein n=1 Tax=Bengtsoniella intestinalis TaxID=3073143 RepID=UPI00391F1A9F